MNIVSICFNPKTQDVEIWVLPGNQELPQICKIIKKLDAVATFQKFDWKMESLVDHMYVVKSLKNGKKDQFELRVTDPE